MGTQRWLLRQHCSGVRVAAETNLFASHFPFLVPLQLQSGVCDIERHSRAAGEGNKSPILIFDTVYSGELAVSAKADGTYCMELPAHAVSEEVPDGAGADSALVRVLLVAGSCINHTCNMLAIAFATVLTRHYVS